jgi:hypothetical protein
MVRFTSPALIAAALSLNFFAQNPVYGQQQAPGVVTAVQGQAQLTRPALAKPTSLRQKDDIMLRDVVDTREKSAARMLFGGKATVTLRELSRFEVREETLPGGATRSTIQLNSGAILVNVARQLMKPGDEVIINTNNAVATIRGSMIYAESLEPSQSTFAQISGTATLNCPPPATTPTATLTRFTAADIKGLGTNCNLGPVRDITNEFAALLLRSFQLPRTVTGEGNGSQIVSNGVAETGVLSDAALVVTGGGPQQGPPANSQPSNTIAPVIAGGGPIPVNSVKLPPPCRDC